MNTSTVNHNPRARWADAWRTVRLDEFGLYMDEGGIIGLANEAHNARRRADKQPEPLPERLRLKKFREFMADRDHVWDACIPQEWDACIPF